MAGGAVTGGLVVLGGDGALAQEAAVTAEAVQKNLDNVFVLVCAVLVIFMRAGFALVEAGLTRAKSVANIMMKNLMDSAPARLRSSPLATPSPWLGRERLGRCRRLVPG